MDQMPNNFTRVILCLLLFTKYYLQYIDTSVNSYNLHKFFCILKFFIWAIHKGRHLFFAIFDSPSPLSPILLNRLIEKRWLLADPPSSLSGWRHLWTASKWVRGQWKNSFLLLHCKDNFQNNQMFFLLLSIICLSAKITACCLL